MASSGGTTGTPTGGGGGSGIGNAEPLPYTLLSPEEYRDIMGIPPPHFWSAAGDPFFPAIENCTGIWWKYPWQSGDNASRQELVDAILQAERELADYLGWWAAPNWLSKEHHNYPQHFKPSLVGLGRSVSGGLKTIKSSYGKFLAGGIRATTVIEAGATVTYSDEDADGYSETATITVTTAVNTKETKVFFAGTSADQRWEVRKPRSITASGGTTTIVFWSWQLISPALQEGYPQTGGLPAAIDAEDNSNYVATVDVYREYNDTTTRHVAFSWGRLQCAGCGGVGCVACDPTTQDGCVHSVNEFAGVLMPQPATLSGTSWQSQEWTDCVEPTQVDLWYYNGNQSERYLRNDTVNPLDRNLAKAIAYMATARMLRSPCSCGNNMLDVMQNDLAVTQSTRSAFRFTVKDIENNPFGTTAGDLMAWKLIEGIKDINFDVALV